MLFNGSPYPAVILLCSGVFFSIWKKKLSPAAAFTGLLCGALIYGGADYAGLLMLTTFFIMGTVATSIGRRKKESIEKAGDSSRRKPAQVLANAGMAALLALLALVNPENGDTYHLLIAVSIASATADTLSSELGMLYGRRFYNCISWKKDERGLDGVVSLEGTLFGIIGAFLIALIYAVLHDGYAAIVLIVVSAAVGNLSDSLLGATVERKKMIGNDTVNFLSTVCAVFFCLLLKYLVTI